MKWTKTEVIGPTLFKLYKTTHDVDNIDATENFLYSALGYHAGRTNIGDWEKANWEILELQFPNMLNSEQNVQGSVATEAQSGLHGL